MASLLYRTALAALLLLAASVASAQNIRIAFIDPLSGPFANVGESEVRHFQLVAEMINARGGILGRKLEIVTFDNKGNPQDSVLQLKAAIDQGIRYILQGNGSGVAHALVDTLEKHNKRNPDQAVVYLNYAAVDPALTNEKCHFWHFRMDVNADMKMEALTAYMQKRPEIKKVYIINQDYAFGRAVDKAAADYLGRKRPDVQIVGREFHPLAQVRDFAPYVAKIKAAGADTIITGNWGADLALMIKSAKDAGLNANFYTYYAGTTGVPTQMGAAGADRVKMVANWHPNDSANKGQDIAEGFKKKFNDDYYTAQTHAAVRMLSEGMKRAKSTEPLRVAHAMSGLKFTTLNGDVEMRASDHQLQQPVYIATWTKTDGKTVRFDQENTGYGWKTDQRFDAYVASQPTSCQMKRPAKP